MQTQDKNITKLRRALYGTYQSYADMGKAVREFTHVQDLGIEYSILINQGIREGWIVSLLGGTPDSATGTRWTIIEDPSITEQRENMVKHGEIPKEVYFKRLYEKAHTEEIPTIKQRLADSLAETGMTNETLEKQRQLLEAQLERDQLIINELTKLVDIARTQTHALQQIEKNTGRRGKEAPRHATLNDGVISVDFSGSTPNECMAAIVQEAVGLYISVSPASREAPTLGSFMEWYRTKQERASA